MHRLLILLCLVAAASASRYRIRTSHHPSRPWDSKMSAADTAKAIKDLLINANSKMQQFCNAYTDRPLVEAYGEKHYKLRVDLSRCNENEIEVRAGQRMVSVQAPDCGYMALHLLPAIVDSNQSFWRSTKGHVTIFFPYTADGGRCGREISNEVHSLPRLLPETEDPETEARFGLRRGMLKDLLDINSNSL